MRNKTILISEAKLSSGIILAMTPIILIVVVLISGFLGRGLEDSMYYRVLGPLIYVIFFGGLTYAFYEFIKVVRGRLQYLTYCDGYIRILEQGSVKLNEIRSLKIEQKFFGKSLIIMTSDRRLIRIRGYLLQRGLDEVKNAIEVLQNSEKGLISPN